MAAVAAEKQSQLNMAPFIFGSQMEISVASGKWTEQALEHTANVELIISKSPSKSS